MAFRIVKKVRFGVFECIKYVNMISTWDTNFEIAWYMDNI